MGKYSKVAFIFPGQGSQKIGMGKSLYNASEVAAEIWKKADEILGFSISELCFTGSEEELKQTKNTQLALYVSECAAYQAVVSKGISPAYTAGHSVGEYAALTAAGSLDFEEGIKLVQVRANSMNDAAKSRPGAMVAILNLEIAVIEKIVAEVSSLGTIGIANFNSPGQIVISGEAAAVEKASLLATEAGARRVVPLAVSGGFHCTLMQEAFETLSDTLKDCRIKKPELPVVLNVTADFAEDADQIKTMLARQVVSQVRWHESMVRIVKAGCDCIVELGPGKVLSGLAKRMEGAPEVFSVEEADELDALVVSFCG